MRKSGSIVFALVVAAGLTAIAPAAPARAVSPEELECLALNVYWEARSESDRGQSAVAHLTLNRVGADGFPDTICGVVKDGSDLGRFRCQFHWFCDGLSDTPRNSEAWERARRHAIAAIDGRSPDPTGGALYFHLKTVNPGWAAKMRRLTRIDDHIFYR